MLPLSSCAAFFALSLLVIKGIRAVGPWDLDGSGPAYWPSTGICLVSSLLIVAVILFATRNGAISIPGVLRLLFLVLLIFAGAMGNTRR